MNQLIVSDGIHQYYKITLHEEDGFDEFTYKILSTSINGSIPCLLSNEAPITLRYKINGIISIEERLSKGIAFTRVIAIIIAIAKRYLELTRYMIEVNQILLDNEAVFIDLFTGEVFLIIVPIINASTVDFQKWALDLVRDSRVEHVDRFAFNKIYSYLTHQDFCLAGCLTLLQQLSQEKRYQTCNSSKVEPFEQLKKVKIEKNNISLIDETSDKNTVNKVKRGKTHDKIKLNWKKAFILIQVLILLIYLLIWIKSPLYTADLFRLRLAVGLILISVDMLIYLKFFKRHFSFTHFSELRLMKSPAKQKKLNTGATDNCNVNTWQDTEVLSSDIRHPYLYDSANQIVYDLNKPVILIGRDKNEVDIFIDKSTVGRKHCTLMKRAFDFEIKDHLSLNGTYINGSRLENKESQCIHHGDTVKIADVELKYFAQ